jgi:acyl carrier protein
MSAEAKIKQLIVKVSKGMVKEDMITMDADMRKDLGLDSLAMMELLVMIEDAFGISVDIEDAQAASTLRLTLSYLEKYLKP